MEALKDSHICLACYQHLMLVLKNEKMAENPSHFKELFKNMFISGSAHHLLQFQFR